MTLTAVQARAAHQWWHDLGPERSVQVYRWVAQAARRYNPETDTEQPPIEGLPPLQNVTAEVVLAADRWWAGQTTDRQVQIHGWVSHGEGRYDPAADDQQPALLPLED